MIEMSINIHQWVKRWYKNCNFIL